MIDSSIGGSETGHESVVIDESTGEVTKRSDREIQSAGKQVINGDGTTKMAVTINNSKLVDTDMIIITLDIISSDNKTAIVHYVTNKVSNTSFDVVLQTIDQVAINTCTQIQINWMTI